MKKYVMLVAATLLLCNVLVSAQEQAASQKKRPNQKEFRENKRPMLTAQQRTDRMTKELNLTESEKAKVLALMEKQDAKQKQHQVEMQKMREVQKVRFENERKTQDAELKKIIGEEKFQQLEKTRAQQKEKMMERKDKMQGDSATHMNKRQGEKRKKMQNK